MNREDRNCLYRLLPLLFSSCWTDSTNTQHNNSTRTSCKNMPEQIESGSDDAEDARNLEEISHC
ncbi:hypothetical protein L228DRAFT_88628 [Xylona heveae TC161]|uniref:Uncharacterized protein n=1 Tax=Xylona heveae (strain CBS 132557 / TC161) TaxID=1328760 RepID=A0A165HY42_XYLHT|nr:hypothetical protein L228DRAFT_88628 [Xylona heveae TC161]KZF24088.1 hypothetical protein L228DRAFT_88628 [Xylona heveae TC161]